MMICISLVCIRGALHGQNIPHVRIRGRVIDGASKKPLFYANVFLANTTRGAATDAEGRFTIDKIPLGTYELVATMMGYEKEIKEITLKEPKDATVNFELWPRPLQAPAISVEAVNPREWQRHLTRFKQLFIGLSPNADQCIIRNPEVLDFEYSEETEAFRAHAQDILEIENRALGYQVLTELVDFSFRDIVIRYMVRSRYVPLEPENEKEQKKWERNRNLAYYGSLRHFLITLASDEIESEGYRISLVDQLSGTDSNRNIIPVEAADIAKPGDLSFERKLMFNNFLQVVYTREGQEFESGPLMASGRVLQTRRKVETHQVSYLKLSLDFLVFNEAGYFYNPYGLSTYGNWSWERYADLLPLDYAPDQ